MKHRGPRRWRILVTNCVHIIARLSSHWIRPYTSYWMKAHCHQLGTFQFLWQILLECLFELIKLFLSFPERKKKCIFQLGMKRVSSVFRRNEWQYQCYVAQNFTPFFFSLSLIDSGSQKYSHDYQEIASCGLHCSPHACHLKFESCTGYYQEILLP
jgi:hypothetical protein